MSLRSARTYAVGNRRGYGCKHSVARQTDGYLLIRRETQRRAGIRHAAHYQAAVVAPVESHPRCALPGLILKVRRLVELFVMIDAEHAAAALPLRCYAKTRLLRLEVPCRHARHHHQRAESMEIRHARSKRKPGDLRVMPFDREGHGGIAEDAEIVPVMRVLPQYSASTTRYFPKACSNPA